MLIEVIKNSADKYGMDYHLLNALVATESGYNPNVIRYEPDYKWLYSHKECAGIVGCTLDTMITMQKTSWGLGQLMGANYYEMQGKNWATILLDPEVNLKFVCEHLRKIISLQNLKTIPDIYAAYNGGAVKKKNGNYINIKNVERFMKIYNNIKKI